MTEQEWADIAAREAASAPATITPLTAKQLAAAQQRADSARAAVRTAPAAPPAPKPAPVDVRTLSPAAYSAALAEAIAAARHRPKQPMTLVDARSLSREAWQAERARLLGRNF